MKLNSTSVGKIALILAFFISNKATAQSSLNSYSYINSTGVIGDMIFNVTPNTDNKNKINLNWVIGTKGDDDHFEVERSFDEKDFKTIGLVLDAQTANSTSKQYSFRDGAPEIAGHNIIYYRLKQVNINGTFFYSTIKLINTTSLKNAASQVQLLPNPYTETININFVATETGTSHARLINSLGEVMVTKEGAVNKGENTLQLTNLKTIPTGLYYIDISVNGKIIDKQQIVKQ